MDFGDGGERERGGIGGGDHEEYIWHVLVCVVVEFFFFFDKVVVEFRFICLIAVFFNLSIHA